MDPPPQRPRCRCAGMGAVPRRQLRRRADLCRRGAAVGIEGPADALPRRPGRALQRRHRPCARLAPPGGGNQSRILGAVRACRTAGTRRPELMKRLLAGLMLLAAWAVPSVASAHPLGNFTVNHYARLEPAADVVRVVYVLDMSEIPTFQEKPRFAPDPDGYADGRAEQIRQNLHLELNGRPAPLELEQRAISFPEGTGGLETLRLEAVYSAPIPASSDTGSVDVTFRDDNDPTRISSRGIVARPAVRDVQLQHTSVPAPD